jgi:hypothetical protein
MKKILNWLNLPLLFRFGYARILLWIGVYLLGVIVVDIMKVKYSIFALVWLPFNFIIGYLVDKKIFKVK